MLDFWGVGALPNMKYCQLKCIQLLPICVFALGTVREYRSSQGFVLFKCFVSTKLVVELNRNNWIRASG